MVADGKSSIADADPMSIMMTNATYVPVDTELRLPLRMLMASAMTDPMNDPNEKMAQKIPNALPVT